MGTPTQSLLCRLKPFTKEKERKIRLYNDMDSPVRRGKEYLKSGGSPNDMELMTVEIKDEKIEIKSMPSNMIVVGLVKE